MDFLRPLYVLLTMLASVYSQDLTLSGANVITLNNGNNDLYPVRFYNNWQRNPVTGSVPTLNIANLDECLRACVNANGAVLPTGTINCNAIDWIPGAVAPNNCLIHVDLTCSIAQGLYTANAGSTHYIVIPLCDPTRVVRRPDSVLINTGMLPAGITAVPMPTQTTAADCGLLCNLVLTCVAADYSTLTGCRHYATATPTFGNCLPTVSTTGGTAYVFPCNVISDATPFGGLKVGLVPNAVAQAATNADFFACRALCVADAECIGYRYDTRPEFLISAAAIASRCALYDKYAVATSIACMTAVPAANMFTALKFPCRFTAMPNMRKVGGIPQPQWRTLYECERECHFNPMCTGYDWNTETTTLDRDRCWFHTEYRGGCENVRASTMVDHYDLIQSRCSTNADDYYLFLGVQLSGTGTTVAAATTYALCLAACNSAVTCLGFDFITPTTCITHVEATVCTSFTPNTLATHYRKSTYECNWRFRNAKRSGGVAQMGVSILGNCERVCRQTAGCEGFDFDRTGRVPGTPCFLHLTGTVCNPLVRAADIEHYRIRTRVCPDELNIIGIANWGNAMQNVHTIGNRRQGVEQSAIECLQTCVRLGNRQCAGVDFDRRTGFCYIVQRNNACQATASVLNHVDRIQLPTGCNAPTVTGYTGTGSQHRRGGQLRDSNSNPTECSTICNGDPLCIGFDFDRTNNECWTHSMTNECRMQSSVFNNFCCDHYVNSSYSCNNFGPPTFTGYTLRDMLHVPGGLPTQAQLNIVTERQCILHCTSRADCRAVDFNFGKDMNICYVHTSTSACNTEVTNTLVHRYVKAGNCGL